jgi:hypothetical protein
VKEDPNFYKVDYLSYLALAGLLGRVAGRARLTSEDEDILTRAFDDVNEIMRDRGSEQEFKRTHDDGYAMFER